MEIISTQQYPRHLPTQPLPKARSLTLVGKVLDINEDTKMLTIQTEFDRDFKVEVAIPHSIECAELRKVKFIEVRGFSEHESLMTLKEYCDLRDNFDLKTYNEVLRLTEDPQFRHMFGKQN